MTCQVFRNHPNCFFFLGNFKLFQMTRELCSAKQITPRDMWLLLTADWTPREKKSQKRHRGKRTEPGRRWLLLLSHDRTRRCPFSVHPLSRKQEADGPMPGSLCGISLAGDKRREWLLLLRCAESCWPDQLERSGGGGESFTFLTSHGGGTDTLWKIQPENTKTEIRIQNTHIIVALPLTATYLFIYF